MKSDPAAPRFSVRCSVCGLVLCNNRSANKAKKVYEQHETTTGHPMEFMEHTQ